MTGSDDEAGLGQVAQLAEPLLSEPRRVTGRAFTWREGSWTPYLPPDDHPAHEQFLRLLCLSAASDYADQQEALNERLSAAGDDLFVASVMLVEGTSKGLISLCSWTQGVVTLLPRTDRIAFVSPGEGDHPSNVMQVPWDEAIAVVGDLMKPQGLRPERWRVDAFPTPEELSALQGRAVS